MVEHCVRADFARWHVRALCEHTSPAGSFTLVDMSLSQTLVLSGDEQHALASEISLVSTLLTPSTRVGFEPTRPKPYELEPYSLRHFEPLLPTTQDRMVLADWVCIPLVTAYPNEHQRPAPGQAQPALRRYDIVLRARLVEVGRLERECLPCGLHIVHPTASEEGVIPGLDKVRTLLSSVEQATTYY